MYWSLIITKKSCDDDDEDEDDDEKNYFFVCLYLQKEHNETVSKLEFVLDLVECINDIAKSRSSPLTASFMGLFEKDRMMASCMSDKDRQLEQLALYMRSLHLLSSAMQLAQTEMREGHLQPSSNVRSCIKIIAKFISIQNFN